MMQDLIRHSDGRLNKPVIIAGLLIIVVLAVLLLVLNKPSAERQERPEKAVRVEVLQMQTQDYGIYVNASGSVNAVTRSQLTSQLRGEITYVSKPFNNGGQFNKGDTLLQIDKREYIANADKPKHHIYKHRQTTVRNRQPHNKR